MCRYAFKKYKPHYVCFDCHKTFKQPLIEDMVIENGEWEFYKKAYLNFSSKESISFRNNNPELIKYFEERYRNKKYLCPDCGNEMHNIGLDFKAPKKEKTKEWSIIKSMYKLGNTFHTCGCSGPGWIPKEKEDYLEYLEKLKLTFQNKLHERNETLSTEEFNDYLYYWTNKLNDIEMELKNKNSW